MRLSLITDEASQKPEQFLRLVVRQGVDALELRSVWNQHVSDLPAGRLAELWHAVHDAGCTVACISTSVFKCSIDMPVERELTKLNRALDAAAALRCTLLRIFTFWRGETRDDARIAAAVTRAHEEATARGMTVAIENGKRTSHASGGELADFLALLERQGVHGIGAVWDPANSVAAGFAPQSLRDGYEALQRHVVHVHVKDLRWTGDAFVHVPIGQGVIDWDEQAGLLARDGYRGFLSLETHWRPDAPLPADALDLPGGDAFSAGGMFATEVCVRALRACLAGEVVAS